MPRRYSRLIADFEKEPAVNGRGVYRQRSASARLRFPGRIRCRLFFFYTFSVSRSVSCKSWVACSQGFSSFRKWKFSTWVHLVDRPRCSWCGPLTLLVALLFQNHAHGLMPDSESCWAFRAPGCLVHMYRRVVRGKCQLPA